jgi:acyl carrier protein
MNNDQITKNVCKLLKQINPELQDFDAKAPFKDLGINSIDKIDLINMTFEEFSIKLSSDELIKVNTVEQLVQALVKKINEK